MGDVTRYEVDKDELLRVTKILFGVFESHKIDKLTAGCAMRIMLDVLKDEGLDIQAVQMKSFKEEQ